MLHLNYLWLAVASFTTIKIITGHSKMTVTRVQKRLQTQILYKKESNIKVGGIEIEVQLDESKFGKRKHNRGHNVEVFGCLVG
jgi:hypothetical protein